MFSWAEIYWELHEVTKFHVLKRVIKMYIVPPKQVQQIKSTVHVIGDNDGDTLKSTKYKQHNELISLCGRCWSDE